ncbi:hypothetical protein T459_25449 [Capsicum annuum]|uniref:ABC transporter domain-containing protein n=1 Tax=Capsicum annuum TaxID=4072 RepID=A0A2G2YKX0_CAPAN|nr:hypothetical protein T459_25449 [Capsicum annuum]
MHHPIFHASGSVEGHWIRIPPPHKTSFYASDIYDMKEDESLFASSGIVSFQERDRGYELDTAARHGSADCIREHLRQDQIEDLSSSPPAVGSIQIGRSNGFGHNIEFMSQAYLRNRSSDINIEVKISQASSNNPVKEVASKVASQFEHDNYKLILKVRTRKGEILALMGPSGSGKTTLLKILGERLQENVRGTATYNDIPYNTAINKRHPSKMSQRQKYERAEVHIKELGLERCRHTRIGGGLIKGIFGGEREKTSIGYEILVDPFLLLLDEPTSGLDSSSARKERVGSPFRLSVA